MKELTQEEERQLDQLHERREALTSQIEQVKSLLEHPGWQHLRMLMEGQLRARRIESYSIELQSIDSILKAVSDRGHMAALQIHINLPRLALDDLEADLASVRADLEELTGKEDEDGRS